MRTQIQMTIQRGEEDVEVTVQMYFDGLDVSDIYAQNEKGEEVKLTNDEEICAVQMAVEQESERYFNHRSVNGI